MAVQSSYSIYPERGFPGSLARPSEPHALDGGGAYVPAAATRKPRPGDAVYYDTTNNGFAIPTTAAQLLLVSGILSYRADTVQTTASIVEFSNGDEVEVAIFGTFWVVAGSAMEYGQIIGWDLTDFAWDPDARVTTVATIVPNPIVCVSRTAVAAAGIAEARIGYGRVI